MPIGAEATGIANIAMDGTTLDTWYPSPKLIEDEEAVSALVTGTRRVSARDLSDRFLAIVGMDRDRLVELVPVHTAIADLSAPPVDAHDVYLRLHLLSHRLVKPLEVNMTDCLTHLVPVVWTNKGPCLSDNFEFVRASLRSRGQIHVYGIERLPRMVDYVVPSGVSIAEAERVRLGAYLAPGTSVMREGYVSFNAGSLGPARIEGRLSSSVVVDEGTDIGSSATLIATISSGRNRTPLRLGRDCRLRPSAGVIGIDLGDRCEIGVNVMLERDTTILDTRSGAKISAGAIAGLSDIIITNEPDSSCPVLRPR
ncbi:2,3,4,5-tetrahydropyridine-2-carboxylate N-succinyltransferase [Corynebacterium mycetoides]|uniref:2,3,4,5-tetrahydropyridine-2-carboxylate N-succinyltransferase n=1 Tax=Corynebacterium mycetoides TaxID=38302 RepID=A0A1G9LRY5_9CORY|nr:succinyltransferase [Corynebacterium mycetoides]SDL64663.1 2,3,4,5-tetrahydropyridine-2-carboxylate N-succinyltransferase [Corynebacterium mycetoides]